MKITYQQMIKEAEKKALTSNMEVNSIKWMFMVSDFKKHLGNLNELVSQEDYETFSKMVDRFIINHEPPQYIINKACFFGYDFYVDENVFIPRNETEQLVEECIYRIDDIFENKKIRIADVCCGSGIIGITLKKEVSNCEVYMCDVSHAALDIVKKNAQSLEADVITLEGDFIQPLLDNNLKFDVIVCNPPYIKNSEQLDDMVVEHEPNIALFGGVDGLDFYRKMFKNYKSISQSKALLAFEIGYDQKKALEELILRELKDVKYEFLKDYAGLDRMLFIYSNI